MMPWKKKLPEAVFGAKPACVESLLGASAVSNEARRECFASRYTKKGTRVNVMVRWRRLDSVAHNMAQKIINK
jgi:hypothetical protein